MLINEMWLYLRFYGIGNGLGSFKAAGFWSGGKQICKVFWHKAPENGVVFENFGDFEQLRPKRAYDYTFS